MKRRGKGEEDENGEAEEMKNSRRKVKVVGAEEWLEEEEEVLTSSV